MTLLWIEIRWKQDNLFLPQFGSLFQAFRSWGQRKEMWAKKKKQTTTGWGRAEDEGGRRSLLSRSFPPFCFFLALFLRAALHYTNAWNRLQFPSGRFSSTSTSGNAFLTGFDPVWPKPACAYRTSPIATGCKRPGVVCLRKVKETRGHGRRLQRAS